MNWNNRPAPRWGAADDNWAYGSVQRVQMLLNGLATRDKHDLASVTSAMNAAATQDLRSVALTPALTELLKAAPAPSPRAARMLAILQEWRAGGSSRLDRDLDGVMDAGPGPALWDALYPRLFNAAMPVKGLGPLIGTSAGPSSGFTDGGFWYLEKDFRRLNGGGLRRPFKERYCGNGDRARCARAVWAALEGIPGDPGRATRGRHEGADRVPARAAADHDPLHEPPERDPAGDLLQRPPAALGGALEGVRRAERVRTRRARR